MFSEKSQRKPVLEDDQVNAVRRLEGSLSALAIGELRSKARDIQKRASLGEALSSLMPEAFALYREASTRTLGLRPFDEQIRAGIALFEGAIVEMETGEGKTLAAVAPAYLRSLQGQGMHVLTYNDYLARRDARWMEPLYELLGISVGYVQEGMSREERRKAYGRDVTYLTAREAGFDLLRDQLCLEVDDQAHRGFYAALVDEADSILIDEARIPLVIAGERTAPPLDRRRLAELARELEAGLHYDVDEYGRNIFLTEAGSHRVENLLGCGVLYAPENVTILGEVRNALHAQDLLHRGVDYIVSHGAIELVDELTGRVAENRHWPDGLHAAVEAKEGLSHQREGRILGSIALQHFLPLYGHLSGMTGTAQSGSEELQERYGLPVVVIPTHRPRIRQDLPDQVFLTREAKNRALVKEIIGVHATGRPILVGTSSVRESEDLAARLREQGVACRVLNARNDEDEAAIVAEAGGLEAVTISTNMAGRGTDIRLGAGKTCQESNVKELGGLCVIGTNRHESRRIDDQLRGRAGRQGDPGSTCFFISLEDDLAVRYGIKSLLPDSALPQGHDGLIDLPLVRREVARVQRIVEGQNQDIRRRLADYAWRIEAQRRSLAEWRQQVLEGHIRLDLLNRRSRGRWQALVQELGQDLLAQVEKRLTLLLLDRCWSEHLAELRRLRDEIHLVSLGGQTPLVEFARAASAAFQELHERLESRIVETFESLEITAAGVDWEAADLRGPSATWTYLVNDKVFEKGLLQGLAQNPAAAPVGIVTLGPLLFLWGLYQHWRKRQKARKR